MTPLYFDAYTRFGPVENSHGKKPWKLEHLMSEMDHCSISGALVMNHLQLTYDALLENRRLSDTLADHDHLFPIWNVFPHWAGDFPEPDQLTNLLNEHDVRAVMLAPRSAGFELGLHSTAPLLQSIQDADRLAVISFDEIGNFELLERFLIQWPQLKVFLRNFHWGMARKVIPLVLNHPNLHICFDAFQSNLAIEWLVSQNCEDQLLFASNAVDMSIGAHRSYIDWADISDEAKAKVASGNLIRLLKVQAPPRERSNANEDEIMAAARQGKPLPCLTLDMHAHMLDEGAHSAGHVVMRDGGPSGVHRLAQRMGVDGMGLMSWNGPVCTAAEQGNECVSEALDAREGFYWGLGTFDVLRETPEYQVARMEEVYKDPRFMGMKPYPRYGIRYDDKRYDHWWEYGNKHHLYAGVHPVAWYKIDEFASICKRFPNLTVVAYHSGGSYDIADVVIELAKTYPNFMTEPTLTPSWHGIIDYLVEGCGSDRVMYGSDLPMRDPRQQLGWIVYSRLPLAEKKAVLGGNAQRLLRRIQSNQSSPFPYTFLAEGVE